MWKLEGKTHGDMQSLEKKVQETVRKKESKIDKPGRIIGDI